MFLNNKKIILGNWKMNQSLEEMKEFFKGLEPNDKIIRGICPQSPYLKDLSILSKDFVNFHSGSQNVADEEHGAFTGETSILTLKDFDISFTLVGHSERRQIFNENPSSMIKKINLAMKHKIGVVYCLGETLEQREANKVREVLKAQLIEVLSNVENLEPELICIAYEPVWAIGTGKTAGPEQAVEAHRVIKEALISCLGEGFTKTPILYGGSVKPSNAADLLSNPEVSGALIGGASLKAQDYNAISHAASVL